MNSGNPYVTDKSVGSTDAFVGRQDILDKVKAVLKQKKAIILNGLRRIGKTSVLNELAVRLPEEGAYVPVYFILNEKTNSSLEEELQELANRIRDVVSPSSDEPDLNADPNRFFKVLLPELLKKLSSGKSLVLLFDEFEIWAAAADGKTTKAKQASAIFFSYLSDLLHSDYDLKFVFTIGCSFAQFNEEALHAFREITDVTQISLLKKEETHKIIRFSEGNNTLKWSTEAIEKIWEQTQGHPFLTQTLCEKVWNNLCDSNQNSSIPTATIKDVEQTITEILKNENNLPALYWIWDGLLSTEQLVASALATKGPEPTTQFELGDFLRKKEVPIEPNKAIASLKEWDLIEPVEENGYRFRIELLRRWIAKYHPFNQTRDEYRKSNAIRHYEKGQELYEKGNLSKAKEALYKVLNLNTEVMGAAQLLAKILLEDEQPDIEYARELLEKALDCQYDFYNTQFLYVKALLMSARLASNEEEQLAWCERVLKLEPEHEEAKHQRQTILQRQNKHVEKNSYPENQANSINAAFEKKLTHVDQKIEDIKNSLDHLSQNPLTLTNAKRIEEKTPWLLIGIGLFIVITIVILVVGGFQTLTLGKLEKALEQENITVIRKENDSLRKENDSLRKENDSLKKELELSKKEIQRLKDTINKILQMN